MRTIDLIVQICMISLVLFSCWSIEPASSQETEAAFTYTTERILLDNGTLSLPDGIELSGTGSMDDPFILDSIWINQTDGPAIWINGSTDQIIIRNTAVTYGIWTRSDGIFISNSTNVTIVDSLVQNCYIGLHIDNSSDIRVIGSDLSGNTYGIMSRASPDNNITDCSMNGNLIDGLMLEGSDRCTISFCQFISNSARIANDAAIRAVRSSDTIVQGCDIKMNYGTGISLIGPITGCIVMDCDVNYNNEGMILENVGETRVQGIEMIINMKAMELGELRDCSFADLTIFRNQNGMELRDVHESSFIRIELEECGYGFDLERSHNNTFLNCTITGSKRYDLKVGIPLDHLSSSDHNVFSGNYFQKGCKVLPSVHDNGFGNRWDLDGIGNIWSGSDLEDQDLNGLGDLPVEINGTAGSKDMFPRTDMEIGPDRSPDDPVSGETGDEDLPIIVLLITTGIVVFFLIALILARRGKDPE